MSDNRKEAEEKMAKAIFISGDGWLAVFDLLAPSQLGLGISMISHRFDFYVQEHFKTRKWALKSIRIYPLLENGEDQAVIFNSHSKLSHIPQTPLPKKVVGFERIFIIYIDQNVIAFLRRFHQLFATSSLNLAIYTHNDRIMEFFLRNIWPMLGKNILGIELSGRFFHRLRQFAPSLFNDLPLRIIEFYATANLFTEFPADDNAMASDGQALAKWLFTALPNNVPKVLKCSLDMADDVLTSKIEDFGAAFASASSPANFIVVILFPSFFADSVMPFDLTNELTREQLALKRTDCHDTFLLVRCPIARDASKWTKWEEEAIGWKVRDQWNQIDIYIDEELDIGDGLLDESPGPSDQQK